MKKNNCLAVCIYLHCLVVFLLSGCASISERDSYRYIHPRVAVYKFDNKAGSPMRGDLGTGMADLLVTALMNTGRFTVVERSDLDVILSEIDLQRKGITREEGKVPPKRILNVQYLIKGTVTDFSHVSMAGIGLGVKSARASGHGGTAIVSMVISVIDIESGEILLSTTASSEVRCSGIDITAVYNDVSFGGKAFYRTPLGKATRSAIDKAVKEIIRSIGTSLWYPAIASIEEDKIIINGGKDRKIKTGALYHIIESGEEIFDSISGDLLGRAPGNKIGVIEITEVFHKFSYARLLYGEKGDVGSSIEPLTAKEASEFKKSNFSGN